MPELIKTKEPFKFYTRLHLSKLTGLKGSTLSELLELIKQVPDSCIYHHTHRFLQQHQYLSPEPPNDFAYWVSEFLGENELGERLASINIIQFPNISDLRGKIIETIEDYLKNAPSAKLKFAHEGGEFHFIKSISFVLPTPYIAYNLNEFIEILGKISINSLYFHIFEARMRLGRDENDFTAWLKGMGEIELAKKLSKVDPYTITMEGLREKIIRLVRKYVGY